MGGFGPWEKDPLPCLSLLRAHCWQAIIPGSGRGPIPSLKAGLGPPKLLPLAHHTVLSAPAAIQRQPGAVRFTEPTEVCPPPLTMWRPPPGGEGPHGGRRCPPSPQRRPRPGPAEWSGYVQALLAPGGPPRAVGRGLQLLTSSQACPAPRWVGRMGIRIWQIVGSIWRADPKQPLGLCQWTPRF